MARIFREAGIDAHRGYVFHRESDVVGVPGIHCEVKHVEKLNVRQAYKQAVTEAEKRKDGEPVVFHKKNNDGWLVTLSLPFFLKLIKLYLEKTIGF